MHRSFVLVAGIMALSFPAQAWALGDCESSEWFCEDEEATEEEAADGEKSDERIIIIEREEAADDDGEDTIDTEAESKTEDDRIVVVIPEDEKKRKKRLRREWGLNLRLQSALMGDHHGKHEDAQMVGLGGSFRYRAVPHFAFDLGLDFLGGRDWNGDKRTESIFSVSGIIFLNPQNKLQVYMIGGMDFAAAEVDVASLDQDPFRDEYSYFGGHFGGGLEFRVGRKTALNLDLVGFLRGRTDVNKNSRPEYVDPDTGLATNTSGGGLGRAGITFYW